MLPAHAQGLFEVYGPSRVVSDAVLAEQRGGFFGRDGLQVAIGLEQTTVINGDLVHRSVLRELSPLGEKPVMPGMEQVVIRNGLQGAQVQRSLSDQGWVTIIQNDLHGQSIQHQLTLDIELDNLSMPRSDLGRSLERHFIESSRTF
ncbi:MAG: hypothetical protein EA349_01210 [Halomonadaceae bacterium]|nr:MAG: hypothetical protein EA349_01210 [Halomonadaceae bacterium]